MGNTCAWRSLAASITVHPHERGEHGLKVVLEQQCFGSSPRAWGTPVYIDKEDQALLYLFPPGRGESGKIVIRVNFTTKLSGIGRVIVNAVRTAGIIKNSDIKPQRYEKIWP